MQSSKLKIYKEMIHYIIGSTNYNLKNIAELSNTSIQNIQAVYCEELPPASVSLEIKLIKLYQTVLEINSQKYL